MIIEREVVVGNLNGYNWTPRIRWYGTISVDFLSDDLPRNQNKQKQTIEGKTPQWKGSGSGSCTEYIESMWGSTLLRLPTSTSTYGPLGRVAAAKSPEGHLETGDLN
jgi:hypothetical protein